MGARSKVGVVPRIAWIDDLEDVTLRAEVKRLREAGLEFRNAIITGPGGSQIILDDPSGNPVELFQPSVKP